MGSCSKLGTKQGPCGNVAKFGFHAVWRNSRSLHFCPDHWHRPTASMLFCSMTTGNLILEPLRHFVISTPQKNMTSKKAWICHFKLDMYIFYKIKLLQLFFNTVRGVSFWWRVSEGFQTAIYLLSNVDVNGLYLRIARPSKYPKKIGKLY